MALASLSRCISGLFQSTTSTAAALGCSIQSVRAGSTWRDMSWQGAWPNHLDHYTHRKHFHPAHTWGVQKQTRMRVIDNSKIGREAMAEGNPPKIIQVYSKVHSRRPHGAYGKLGDRVKVAIKGQKKQGIIVGLKMKQLHGVPRFDSNNIVLIQDDGSPLGNRIHAPIPNCIREILKFNSHPKKADYTKIMAIATRFV